MKRERDATIQDSFEEKQAVKSIFCQIQTFKSLDLTFKQGHDCQTFERAKSTNKYETQVSLVRRKEMKQAAITTAATMRKEVKATFLQGHDETAQKEHKHCFLCSSTSQSRTPESMTMTLLTPDV